MASDPTWMMTLDTALGDGALQPIHFTAEEALNQPFEVTVEAVSATANIDPNALLATSATLTLQRNNDDGPRSFVGKVRAFTSASQKTRDMYHYTLSIVPLLWFMDQQEDCRIFQNKSIPDIINIVCGQFAVPVTINATGSTDVRAYVTQYNETTLHFITRLMEQAGFFYYFDTSGDLVVADANTQLPSSPKPTLTVIHEGENEDILTSWQQMPATAWGKVDVTDYDPTAASSPPDATTNTVLKASDASSRSVMRWPAFGLKSGQVNDRAKFMVEAAEAEAQLISCTGFDSSLSAGSRFTLAVNPISQAKSVDYFVRRIIHSGSDTTVVGGGNTATYSNSMLVLPMTVPFRPRMVTPRPQMPGIYAGIVVGTAGEEIDVSADAGGSIKVRMYFDHNSTTDPSQAPWVRVMQSWAGNSWGQQYIPRVGTEVAVAFMDGDPDRPVVIGGMYNSNMAPIFGLPAQKNKTGLRTRSTKGGGTDNFSEFSIDDTTGSELVYLHAEKDLTKEVENNETITIGNNRTTEIQKGFEKLTVDKGDRTVTVSQGNDTHVVSQGNRVVTVSQGNDTHTVSTGNREATISTGNEKLTVSTGDRTTEISQGNDTLKIDQGNRETTISMGDDKLTISMGNLTIDASMGKISITAMQGLELTVGGNSIKIDPSGVSISGTMVKIEGQAMTSLKGPMTQVNGDGMLMLKGGISMIN